MEQLTCNICEIDIPPEHDGKWTGGHNPEPIYVGESDFNDRCCAECNDRIVLPARLKIMQIRLERRRDAQS